MSNKFNRIKYHPIWQRYKGLPLCLLVTFFSQALAILLIFVVLPSIPKGGLIDTLISSFKEDWYVNTFFTDMNNSHKVFYGDDDIIIIDIRDSYSSREHIADILKRVSLQKPKAIFVDMLFYANESFDNKQNNYLIDAIKSIKDSTKIAFACYKGNDSTKITHSFFMDSLKVDYGLSDFYGYSKFVPYVSDTIPRIATKVANMIGIDIRNIPSPLVVNYRNKEFNVRKVGDGILDLNYSLKGLQDKVVIVGKYNNVTDLHDTPFLVNNIYQLSGIEIIAYELSSLISYSKKERDLVKSPYTVLSLLWSSIIGFILSMIYVFFLRLILTSNLNKTTIILIKAPYLIITELVIVLLWFSITEIYLIIPDILFFVTAILFVDFVTEFFVEFTTKQE